MSSSSLRTRAGSSPRVGAARVRVRVRVRARVRAQAKVAEQALPTRHAVVAVAASAADAPLHQMRERETHDARLERKTQSAPSISGGAGCLHGSGAGAGASRDRRVQNPLEIRGVHHEVRRTHGLPA